MGKAKEKAAPTKEDLAHDLWLYWHGYNATVIAGPYSGHWGVAQGTGLETNTVSLSFPNKKENVWFNVADLQRWERK